VQNSEKIILPADRTLISIQIMPSWLGFLFATAFRPALGTTQSPIQCLQSALSSGVRRPGREADYLPPLSAEIKNAWNYTSTPPYPFMA